MACHWCLSLFSKSSLSLGLTVGFKCIRVSKPVYTWTSLANAEFGKLLLLCYYLMWLTFAELDHIEEFCRFATAAKSATEINQNDKFWCDGVQLYSCSYIPGARRLAKDIQVMTGRQVSMFWLVCWYGVSPAFILVNTKSIPTQYMYIHDTATTNA